MKFDKETIIILLLTGLFIAGWMFFYPRYQEKKLREAEFARLEQEQNERDTAPETLPEVAQETATPVKPAPGVPEAATPAPSAPVAPVKPAGIDFKPEFPVLENDLVRFTFDEKSGAIASVEFKKYKKDAKSEALIALRPAGKEWQTFQTDEFSNLPLLAKPAVKKEAGALTIDRRLPGYRVVQRFKLEPDSCRLKADFSIQNTSGKDKIIPELVFHIAGMPPMRYYGNKVNTQRQNVDYRLDRAKSVVSQEPDVKKPEKLEKKETNEPVSWAGSTNKYFASLLFPEDRVFDGGVRLKQDSARGEDGKDYAIPSAGGVFKNIFLPANGAVSCRFLYYCGPKELREIDRLPEGAAEVMHIAYWSWFEFIARPLVRFLVWLHSFVGNYGIAIILLTLIVRLVFWPVTQKSNTSMRKMQKIQPQLKELREKYKSNPQELNLRMMELYKKEGVNPLGGCLPVLLQIPVFFALYSALDSAVELRHVPFLWAADLTKPDLVGPAINLPLLGEVGIHPWIIMMTILMVVQQKMTPSQGDPMQQKMMMAMPVIMLVMLYNLPSGLTLYWTISQLFSVIQMKYGLLAAAKEENGGNHTNGRNKPEKAK